MKHILQVLAHIANLTIQIVQITRFFSRFHQGLFHMSIKQPSCKPKNQEISLAIDEAASPWLFSHFFLNRKIGIEFVENNIWQLLLIVVTYLQTSTKNTFLWNN